MAALLVAAAGPALAADSDFNGRWDIKTIQPQPRAWWVELNGVGTASPSGRFVSAYGGAMNDINTITVSNGELRFVIIPPASRGGRETQNKEEPRLGPYVYTARLVSGKLEGAFTREGQTTPPVRWTGVRAPAITDKDDGAWKEGKPIALFNGKDLSGWQPLHRDVEMKWSVVDGILRNAPPTTDILTTQKFWNFKLHVDFRIVEHSNSGIGLRGRYEVQIMDDYGRPPNTHGAGALYSRIIPSVNASKPPGEWQSYDIRLVGRQVTVVFNGIKVIDKGEVEGLTAIAENADEGEPGPFILQGDHSYVEVKNFVVTPLTR
ncbi:MAG: DUF1080 domain-containing protein [Bryobacteraceae bacterium]